MVFRWPNHRLNLRALFVLMLGALAADPAAAQLGNAQNITRAAPGPGALTWQLRDVTDKMTDATTHEAFSSGVFDDGVSLEAHASCAKFGVQFALDTFRNGTPASYTRQQDEIDIRVRINGGDVRTVPAKATYTNEAQTFFYDPAAVEGAIRANSPDSERNDPILGSVNNMMGGIAMNAVQTAAAGTLDQLASARSVRVELPLANGNAYVVDLSPKDEALASIVQKCAADLHASAEASRLAEQETQRRAEQARVAKAKEDKLQSDLRVKRTHCPPNDTRVLLFDDQLRSLDEYDPRKPGARATITPVRAGTKVQIVPEDAAGGPIPRGAQIPWTRCVVTYMGPQGRVVGTLRMNNLIAVSSWNAGEQQAGRPGLPE
jgi:hypothetical protein